MVVSTNQKVQWSVWIFQIGSTSDMASRVCNSTLFKIICQTISASIIFKESNCIQEIHFLLACERGCAIVRFRGMRISRVQMLNTWISVVLISITLESMKSFLHTIRIGGISLRQPSFARYLEISSLYAIFHSLFFLHLC